MTDSPNTRRRAYWISFPRGFLNEYRLCYTEPGEPEPAGGNWRQIDRRAAIDYARDEATRRRENPYFAGHADALIAPAHDDRLSCLPTHDRNALALNGYTINNRIIERS